MENNLRNTGITVIGDVPWATHFCQFYQTKKDMLDILVPYFKAGLENNEACMWVTSAPLSVEEARQALSKVMPDISACINSHQLEIVPYNEWYMKDGYFDLQRVLNGWVGKLNDALVRGYSGLRVTGNTAWLEKKDWGSFTEYEAAINGVIGKYNILALCTYSLDLCTASDVMDVMRNHEFALIKQQGKWALIENAIYKDTKEALSKREAELSTILANVPVPVFVIDPERHVLNVNAAAAKFAGHRVEEMLELRTGEALGCLHSLDDPRGCGFGPACQSCKTRLTILDTFETGNNHYQVEWHIPISRDGNQEEITFLLSTVLLPTPKKQALLCIEDITEHKRAELEIRRLNQGLQARAAELEAANKELESFSYSVSHDLREPLRTIDGFSHILGKEYSHKLDAEGLRLLDTIRKGTAKMGQLISDLLAFSRLSKQHMSSSEIDMSLLARDVVNELTLANPDWKLEIKIGDLPAARGDRAMLQQVFSNLLSNAMKFTRPKDNVTIEVAGSPVGTENVYSVKDNGVGFDIQYAGKLFNIFQRLHTQEEFEGTGVGLAIVQRIVHRHGGHVWAESKLDEGATFYFALPMNPDAH